MKKTAIISNNVFLKGAYMEVGISECGSFGSTVNAPSGYHGNTNTSSGSSCSGNCALGFVADPDKNGWNQGNPKYFGDFFLPSNPEEGFAIRIGNRNYNNCTKCTIKTGGSNPDPKFEINQNVSVSKDYLCDRHIGIWEGTINNMKVKQTVKFDHEGTYFTIEVEMKNLLGTARNGIYYMRNVNPDNDIRQSNKYETKNTIVFQPNTDPEGKKRALVKAEGTVHTRIFLGLAAVDERARVAHGGTFSNRNPKAVWDGTSPHKHTGSTSANEAISLAFNLGNFAGNETKTFRYAYILDAGQVDAAFAELTGITANGIDITEDLYFKICNLEDITLNIINHEHYDSWVWSPGTNLDTSTGPTAIFTPPASGSYAFDVTGTNSCAETVNYHFDIDVAVGDNTPPSITCPPNQTSLESALIDYRSMVTASDNCASNVGITQDPPKGTDIGNSILVTMTADDFSGNTSTCTFTVTYTGPGTPVATPATFVGTVTAIANWDAANYANGYYFDLSDNAGFYSFIPGYENKYVGNTTSLSLDGLIPDKIYYYRIRSTNGTLISSSSNVISFRTRTPTIQAENIVFSNVGADHFDISWTRGTGDHNLVFIKKANSGKPLPTDGTAYTADSVFGNGTQIGSTGWYCVYNGDDSSASISGLEEGTQYIVKVLEYDVISGVEYYLTVDEDGNPAVQKTKITPSSITWPSASDITFGETLGDSTLSGGSASVPGHFEFVDNPSTQPGPGTTSYTVVFIPDDADTYATVTGSVNVTCNCPSGYENDGGTCVDINECTAGTHNCDTNATCANTPGSYTCDCNAGYTGDGTTCTDIDECTDGTHTCDTNATCTNTPGSYTCDCNAGYTGDGETCTDIDECSDSTLNNCDTNATCTNTPGSYTCDCNAGYTGDGVTCTDIDECSDSTLNNCDTNATCTNTPGSYTCDCNAGYTGDGVTCTDIDECTDGTHTCDTNATCTNTPGSYTCDCNAGYTGDGETCTDIDECSDSTLNNCDTNATCTNTPGSYTCDCNAGYTGDGVTCTDIDECTAGTHNCDTNATCSNTPGSYTCDCNAGYTGDGVTCTDIDECTAGTHNCDTNATCTNTPGSYTCDCNAGYTGDGVTCTDIDECTAGTHNCDTNATCTNTPGSYTCACNSGYSGDGVSCTDINECSDSSLNNCDENATCTNTPGSYTCACNSGYSGDGVSCTDINECSDSSLNNCDENATCTNTPGSYTCACNSGYSGDGVSCTDINECSDSSLNNCDENATCTNTPGSYTCACNSGYSGDGVSCTDINECSDSSLNNCDENATCTNIDGGFECACNFGYDGDGETCEDIDECADDTLNNCDENATCTNIDGGFECACNFGYDGDGETCEDIDECADDTLNNCDENATCTNIDGGFECACNFGYGGDGETCEDIDECADDTLNNCDENATCTNTDGGFECACIDGYEGDGETCEDIDECADDTLNNCDENATCTNSEGSYECACNEGFAGDGETCEDIDECEDEALNNCDESATCTNIDGGFECTCIDGYEGDGETCEDIDECEDEALNNCDENATCANTEGGYECTCFDGFAGDGFTCDEIPLGVCEKPHEIESLPFSHSATTEGRESSVNYYGDECGAEKLDSPDYTYSLELSKGDKVEITLNSAPGFNGILAITSACAENEACLGYADEFAEGGEETIVYEASEDETIFIIVEGSGESTGEFTLDVKEWVEESIDDDLTDEDLTDEDLTDEDLTDEDIGNTGDSGDTGNTGNTGDTGNTGNSGDSGNTGIEEGDESDEDSDSDDETDDESIDDPYEGYKLSGGGCSWESLL
ncbi:MAG: EGF domain-containing protein [bacterium]